MDRSPGRQDVQLAPPAIKNVIGVAIVQCQKVPGRPICRTDKRVGAARFHHREGQEPTPKGSLTGRPVHDHEEAEDGQMHSVVNDIVDQVAVLVSKPRIPDVQLVPTYVVKTQSSDTLQSTDNHLRCQLMQHVERERRDIVFSVVRLVQQRTSA